MINATHNSSLSHQRTKVVLYVEDDESDCLLVVRTARKVSDQLDVRIVRDGQHAMQWLSGTGVYAERNAYPMPDLVLTDLRMRQVSGADLLRWVRNRPEFNQLAVAIYSASMQHDVEQLCQELGAMKFIAKEGRGEALNEFLRAYVADASTSSAHL